VSLRWKISLAFAAVVALVGLAIAILVYQLSAADRADQARRTQAQHARIAARLYASARRLPFGATLNDPSAPAALRVAAARGDVATDRDTHAGQPTVWAAAPVAGSHTSVFVHTSVAGEQSALAHLLETIIVVVAGATVGGALLGLFLATRLSSRLRRAATTASRITGGDLDARAAERGHDEVGALSGALDAMADELTARIQREKRFSADVAHELRTPITGLTTAIELLPDQHHATALVRERTARLRTLVEDLLEISRVQSGTDHIDPRPVDLAAFARDVAAPYQAAICGPHELHVNTDPRHLERIVGNLLENANRHGAPPIQLEIQPDRITVRDAGPGFSEHMLTHATDRFTTERAARGEGIGLGLAIAHAHATVLGAQLHLANHPRGGGQVTVRFSPAAPRQANNSAAEPSTVTGQRRGDNTHPPVRSGHGHMP
jgi:signal transduction histidine kinase